MSKATSTSLQFHYVLYFALFITKCLTATEQGGIFSALDLAILGHALYNDHAYNLGAIIACPLHNNRTKRKIHGGIYATRSARLFNIPTFLHDYLFPRAYLDHQAMETTTSLML